MVAEQQKAIDDMKKEIKKLKEDADNTKETLEQRTERLKKVEEQMAEITEIKDDFGDKLAARLAQIEVDMEQTKGIQEGNIRAVIDGATQKFEELEATGPAYAWCVINTHMCSHFVRQLEKYGPMREVWMYAFESLNSHIKSLARSNSLPVPAIMNCIKRVLLSFVHSWL